NTTIGPYDYWAIEYAYKEIDPANEAAELAKIASRSNEPLLAYATDEDAGSGAQRVGIDPAVNTFDLGNDPLEYYKRRMALNREIWTRAQNRKLGANESYESLTRSLMYGFGELARVVPLAAKYVGGITHLRDRAGSGRPLYEPVPAARQREALNLITRDLFESGSFRFKPEFVSRLSIDHFDRGANPDSSIAPGVLNVQTTVLDVLLSDNVATRMVNAAEKVADPSKLLRVGDLYDALQAAIWSELRTGGDIPLMRRNLQREHVKRITAALLRPSSRAPADAVSLQRENAATLATQIRSAMAKPMSREAKAHLGDSFQVINEALRAQMQKAGV
ncbi:MAG: zinc-dependent metalloprotease, partial [Betaproteobacteria bacterium]|nr:zinc-dependent metalloprotease [Betaproteobacteria bacterium]